MKSNPEYGIGKRTHVSDGTKPPRPRHGEAGAGEGRARPDGAATAGGVQAEARGGDQVPAVVSGPGRPRRGEGVAGQGLAGAGRADPEGRPAHAARRGAAAGRRRRDDPAPPQLSGAEGGLRRPDAEDGLDGNHGLRHAYALDRYEDITGRKAPAAGGPPRQTLKGAERRTDAAARIQISGELGHGRMDVCRAYLA